MTAPRRPKLVLAVIDGLQPAALQRALADGRTPALADLIDRGVYIDDCIAAFPSVTPVCTASIVTGVGPDQHLVPGMNWYHRAEARYVEYGSSFQATRSFGIGRSMTDTIYNLNLAHLSREVPTIFESLDDADVRTAGTTFLMYRGRYRHEAIGDSGLARMVASTLFPHATYGPRELFYADLFASRETGCRSQLGLPGVRDTHAGCVAEYLIDEDLFDFLLLSLPDNDSHSHRTGPNGQVDSLVVADQQLERTMAAAGGTDTFLDEHALIVMADHAHSDIERRVSLRDAFADRRVLQPNDPLPDAAELALCPGWRSAMAYVLDDARRDSLIAEVEALARELEGVDLVLRLDGDEARVASARGELRFRPGADVADRAGMGWSVEGELGALAAEVKDGTLVSEEYPDPLARIWSALHCDNAGEVLLSAEPGYEFTDWGGVDHVGGGSHGSLHRADSLAPLICVGAGPARADERPQWTLRDVVPMVRRHFGLA